MKVYCKPCVHLYYNKSFERFECHIPNPREEYYTGFETPISPPDRIKLLVEDPLEKNANYDCSDFKEEVTVLETFCRYVTKTIRGFWKLCTK